jgi:integrase
MIMKNAQFPSKSYPKDLPIIFRNQSLSRNSQETYSYAVRQYLKFISVKKRAIDAESIKLFLQSLQRNKSASTYNLYRQALKEWLAGLHKDDHQQLFGVLELFKSTKRIITKHSILRDRYLTRNEIEMVARKLLHGNSAEIRVGLMAHALFWSGLRINELLQIRLSDIKVNGEASITVTGKGNRAHTVFLQLNLYKMIVKHFNGKHYLFETKNRTAINRKNATRDIKHQFQKYKYEISSHTFRHSKAMFLKDERGLSADQIQKALNHSTVKTTLENYFHGEPTAADMGLDEDWKM